MLGTAWITLRLILLAAHQTMAGALLNGQLLAAPKTITAFLALPRHPAVAPLLVGALLERPKVPDGMTTMRV
jgi:hypothetical protein